MILLRVAGLLFSGIPRYHLGMAYLKQGEQPRAPSSARAVALAPGLPQRAEIDRLLDELSR